MWCKETTLRAIFEPDVDQHWLCESCSFELVVMAIMATVISQPLIIFYVKMNDVTRHACGCEMNAMADKL